MTEPTQSLMLGDADIGQYIIGTEITSKRLENIKAKVAELKENCLSSERVLYNQLYSEMISAEYPQIDLSFLEKSYKLKSKITGWKLSSPWLLGFFDREIEKDIGIKVPTFSVYPFYGINEFSMKLGTFKGYVEINNRKKILPIILESRLLKSVGAFKIDEINADVYGGRFYYTDRPHERNLYIESEFNGLIPLKTKKKVEKAKKYFKDDIYIVVETKPEEWSFEKKLEDPDIKEDPLVIGLIGKNANIIDHFNTTALENLVKDTYLKDKLS